MTRPALTWQRAMSMCMDMCIDTCVLLLQMQCIVAAELLGLAGDAGIKCGGAMLRDVGVYCLAIFSVLVAFTLGQVRCMKHSMSLPAVFVLVFLWGSRVLRCFRGVVARGASCLSANVVGIFLRA